MGKANIFCQKYRKTNRTDEQKYLHITSVNERGSVQRNCMLEKRRELIETGVARSALKIKCKMTSKLKFFLPPSDFINEDSLRKFSDAVIGGGFLAACVSETWLHSNISYKKLFLGTYELYRAESPSREENITTHGGSLIAVSKSLSSAKIEHNLPHCCVAVKVTINNDKLNICAFYNPPPKKT